MDITKTTPSPYTLRTHRPGDMGWIVHRHGALYTTEFGWNERFEALVARVTADFLENYDPKSDRCWIAERDGNIIGSIMLVKDRSSSDHAAKLRLLLVEPTARGLGLGQDLVRQCSNFAREVGYLRVHLWTNSALLSARRLYEREGYKLTSSEENDTLGVRLNSETWELML
ncbi:GNAT family N-acetyltransferase [Penicillium brevicompactum]|uniref:GNAT family N-acetyltransferase n=1 Tax=Penicillium brevicompactum TaxID=5074 RepID=UPI00253F8C5E|nr:GNAT family N-acetyltransferase [Penicillium brevicompactum]KAJ5326846.1 GNAT family N-acetyltransferase [Penicillium brevicompactum]